jgi:hypothetical protein
VEGKLISNSCSFNLVHFKMKALIVLLLVTVTALAEEKRYFDGHEVVHKKLQPIQDTSIYNFDVMPSIINGSNASPGQFPFVARVSIIRTNADGSTSGGLCSGSLVRSNFALSAAHCVNSNSHLITSVGFLVGTVDRSQTGGSTLQTDEFWFLDKPATLVRDLAMFRLVSHADFSSGLVGAIAIPPENKDHIGPVTLIG